jgi:glutamate-1-semialdehyde 2,1-aminomutase
MTAEETPLQAQEPSGPDLPAPDVLRAASDKVHGSRAMYERARLVTPGGVHGEGRTFKPFPLYLRRAEGARIWDVDGNEYIDYHSGFGAVLLGHNDRRVRQAVLECLDEHGVMLAAANPLELALSEKLVGHIPCAEMALLACTGSEATYHAIRLARAVSERPLVLKFEGNYHGWHDYVAFNTHFDPRTSERAGGELEVVPASAGMAPGAAGSVIVVEYNEPVALEAAFARHGRSIAAVIIEPIFHNLGVVLPDEGFLQCCRRLCDEHGALLIFDEIITGFRHGTGGAQALLGVLPDLATFGKAMANGFPISAVVGARRYMSCFVPDGDVLFAGTFTGQLVNVAAALACIGVLEGADAPYERMNLLTTRLCDGIAAAIEETGVEAQIRHLGSVWAMYFTRGGIRRYRDLSGFVGTKEGVAQRALQRWLLGHGVYVHPHELVRGYVTAAHGEEEIERTIAAVTGFLRRWSRERR